MDKKRILVVDDEPHMGEALRDVLEQEGFLVTVARSEDEMKRFAGSIDFDLVLLDIKLGPKEGTKLIHFLKERSPYLAIIVITAYPSLETAIEAARLGVSDYLLKPISIETLKASIDNALRCREEAQRKEELARELKEANEKLQKMQQTLGASAKFTSIGRIGSGLFHEVKNLLGIMNVSLYYLKKNVSSSDPKLKRHIEIIEKEIEHSNAIIMGLLDISRGGEKKFVLEDINKLLDETLLVLEHELELKGIEVIRNYAGDLPSIFVDKNQMKQVFINLILNAGDAMPGGGELRINTELEREEKSIIIKFIDTGCGIKKEDLNRIFEPFFTTKKEQGLGLGLAVTREIIKAHGGSIGVESKENKGSVFIIKLKIKEGIEKKMVFSKKDTGVEEKI